MTKRHVHGNDLDGSTAANDGQLGSSDADDDGDVEAEEYEDAEDEDEDEADSLMLEEDSDAPNLVPEERPRGILAGRIEMLDKIGEGGMGAVWRGYHLKLDRPVAVKVLDETLQLRADGRERFIREGKALALLDHPNVVRIYDCDQLPDGKLFLCMELLEGDTLRALIKRGVPLDPLEVIDIGLQVCDAIESAHRRGILHRDLTPSNIIRLRDAARTIKVIDWGLCKYLDLFYVRTPQKYGAPPGSRLVTPLGCRFGTPEYMAPEMILRDNPGPPSFCTDVYALGVVLYELLTGRHPFAPGDRKQPRPVRDLLPGFDYQDLESALRDALRFDPEKRTPSMTALHEALDLARECLLAQREAPASPDEEAVAPKAQPTTPASEAADPPCPPVTSTPLNVTERAANEYEAVPRPPPAARQRARGGPLMVSLALVLGTMLGAGGILGMQRLTGSPDAFVSALPGSVLAGSLAHAMARTNAAELRTERCEADMARKSTIQSPITPPPSSVPDIPAMKPKPENPARHEVLAAARTNPRPSTRSVSPASTFTEVMARLEPKIRGCARDAGLPEQPTTVQVRRKDGAVDTIKVLKMSSKHAFAICVDKVVRQTALPASGGPIEDYTFFK